MLLEKESAEFFSDDLIQQRLRNTLHQWVLESFSVGINKHYLQAVQKQHTVGHVHARVGIPSWLIMRGVREIERKIFELLEEDDQLLTLTTCSYLVQVMSFATEIMCRSYEAKLPKIRKSSTVIVCSLPCRMLQYKKISSVVAYSTGKMS